MQRMNLAESNLPRWYCQGMRTRFSRVQRLPSQNLTFRAGTVSVKPTEVRTIKLHSQNLTFRAGTVSSRSGQSRDP